MPKTRQEKIASYSGINEKQSSPELKVAGFWAFSAIGETDFELFRNMTSKSLACRRFFRAYGTAWGKISP